MSTTSRIDDDKYYLPEDPAMPVERLESVHTRTVTVGSGDSARTVDVPEGIDPGWGYAPGREASLGAAVRRRLEGAARQSAAIAAAGVEATLARPAALRALTEEWRQWRRGGVGAGKQSQAMEVGAVTPEALDALVRHGVELPTGAVSVARRELAHLARPAKQSRGSALSEADIDRLPEVIANPQAVLYEPEDRGLLFVFEPADPANRRKGKWFVRVDTRVHESRGGHQRRPYRTNSIRSAGYVQTEDLRDPRYVLLTGEVL